MDRLNLLPCPILVTDGMGRVLALNHELLTTLGGAAEQWLQQPMEAFFPPASRIFLQTHVWPMLLRQDCVREIYLQLCGANKQRIPVMLNCKKGPYEGGVGYYWVFFLALERSRFEAELVQARGDAQQLAADLVQAHIDLKGLNTRLTQRSLMIETENRELTGLSQTDPLTGLANRRALALAVASWQALPQFQASACASMLLIDVDFFKTVNDRHGHDEGDRVLSALARQLQKSMRVSDLAVRYGGEEFVLWLPMTDRAGAALAAQRVHDNVRQMQVANQPITVSIGVATSLKTRGPELLGQLTQQADKALYQAKAAGRNRTIHFE